ncbi:MAG: glutamine--fructose-6-phosphate transaminase (isomerizing) [Deltaproteobacteria bacterium]|nr:glutamine--fructose-6-phosphate transaminase (isomerizing) [Deltaproteobacteria bacterium]
MCGIVGYIGQKPATPLLIEGLRRLEYRGYDSAGIAVIGGDGVQIQRAEGKLAQLELLLRDHPITGVTGIGHTRWATHGKPSETNAHPHRCQNVVVVHNGIIENHDELRIDLEGEGHQFESDTDTEVVCHLIYAYLKKGCDTLLAIRKTLHDIRGSYALAILNVDEPTHLYVARRGGPLVVGFNGGDAIVASDVTPILPHTRRMVFLEDGDFGRVSATGLELFDMEGTLLTRPFQSIPWNPIQAERGGYKHFMLKEIFEQPQVIEDALTGRLSRGRVTVKELQEVCGGDDFPFDDITILACGTSYHSGLIGKYIIEALAGVRVTVDLASEFRYRDTITSERSLVIPITQSGETADTIAATQLMKDRGQKVLAICNAIGSTITRLADATMLTHAGPEIGVASTKAFTTQLVVLYLFALDIGQRRGKLNADVVVKHVKELRRLPRQIQDLLEHGKRLQPLARELAEADHALYIGRGLHYPVALEGALKLKEISYLHAEGFAGGELKHGPIALIDEGTPVIAMALKDAVYEKMLSNIEEVRARGANVLALVTEGDETLRAKVHHVIEIPETNPYLAAVLASIPLQLLAYYVADHKGTDVDQPRNLAKSVTVE